MPLARDVLDTGPPLVRIGAAVVDLDELPDRFFSAATLPKVLRFQSNTTTAASVLGHCRIRFCRCCTIIPPALPRLSPITCAGVYFGPASMRVRRQPSGPTGRRESSGRPPPAHVRRGVTTSAVEPLVAVVGVPAWGRAEGGRTARGGSVAE